MAAPAPKPKGRSEWVEIAHALAGKIPIVTKKQGYHVLLCVVACFALTKGAPSGGVFAVVALLAVIDDAVLLIKKLVEQTKVATELGNQRRTLREDEAKWRKELTDREPMLPLEPTRSSTDSQSAEHRNGDP